MLPSNVFSWSGGPTLLGLRYILSPFDPLCLISWVFHSTLLGPRLELESDAFERSFLLIISPHLPTSSPWPVSGRDRWVCLSPTTYSSFSGFFFFFSFDGA